MHALRTRKDIHRAFEEGVRAYSPWAVLHARCRAEGPPAGFRLGVIASKRVGGSVQRNRARRLLRETSRVLLQAEEAPWDLLLVARADVLQSTFPERKLALRGMFEKAGVLGSSCCTR